MLFNNAKIHWMLYALCLFADVVNSDSLTLNTLIRDVCSRSLSSLIYRICTGGVAISDIPAESLSKVRGKRASMFSRERLKRQVADECCLQPCTVSQLIEYCPETWWRSICEVMVTYFSVRLRVGSDYLRVEWTCCSVI